MSCLSGFDNFPANIFIRVEYLLIYISIVFLLWISHGCLLFGNIFLFLFERHIQGNARLVPRLRSRILLRKSKAVLARGSGSKRGLYWNVDIYFRYFPLRSTWSKDFLIGLELLPTTFLPCTEFFPNPSSRKSFSLQFCSIPYPTYTFFAIVSKRYVRNGFRVENVIRYIWWVRFFVFGVQYKQAVWLAIVLNPKRLNPIQSGSNVNVRTVQCFMLKCWSLQIDTVFNMDWNAFSTATSMYILWP